MSQQRKDDNELDHIVPKWFAWLDRNIALSGLLIMEIFVSWLFLMGNGWVKDITKPQEWTVIQWIGAGVFMLAATGFAGVVVTGSYASARAFVTGHIKKGIFITFGMLLFTGTEIYAIISERSTSVDPSPADRFVGGIIGLNGAITIGIILVAVMVPSAVFYRGWTHVKQQEEDEDTRGKRLRRELEDAKHKAAMREVNAVGWAGALRAGKQKLNGETIPEETPIETPALSYGEAAPNSQTLRAKRESFTGGNGAPKGTWLWQDLQRYISMKYGEELSDDTAKDYVKRVPSSTRIEGVTGKPYGAPMKAVKKWVDDKYSQQDSGPIPVVHVARIEAEG